jgi:hypothetical protein
MGDIHGHDHHPPVSPAKVVHFDIRSIPKKPPAPSVRRRVKAEANGKRDEHVAEHVPCRSCRDSDLRKGGKTKN